MPNKYTWYQGEQVQSTILNSMQTEVQKDAFGFNMDAFGDTNTRFVGFTTTPGSGLNLNLGPGSVYSNLPTDAVAWNLNNADSTPITYRHYINATTPLSGFAAPGTPGYAIDYLISYQLSVADTAAVNLPFNSGSTTTYISKSPSRSTNVNFQITAGTAAASASVTSPTPASGWSPMYVVTVPYGATQLASGMVSLHPSANEFYGFLSKNPNAEASVLLQPSTGQVQQIGYAYISGSVEALNFYADGNTSGGFANGFHGGSSSTSLLLQSHASTGWTGVVVDVINQTSAVGNISFQVSRNSLGNTLFQIFDTGLVSAPSLQVTTGLSTFLGGTATALSSGGLMQTGLASGYNISFDNQNIQARNAGAASVLNLNPLGGGVSFNTITTMNGNSNASMSIKGAIAYSGSHAGTDADPLPLSQLNVTQLGGRIASDYALSSSIPASGNYVILQPTSSFTNQTGYLGVSGTVTAAAGFITGSNVVIGGNTAMTGWLTVGSYLTVAGNTTISGTCSVGTLQVTSTSQVYNLNASMLEGATISNAAGNYIPLNNGALNAGLVAQYLGDTNHTVSSFAPVSWTSSSNYAGMNGTSNGYLQSTNYIGTTGGTTAPQIIMQYWSTNQYTINNQALANGGALGVISVTPPLLLSAPYTVVSSDLYVGNNSGTTSSGGATVHCGTLTTGLVNTNGVKFQGATASTNIYYGTAPAVAEQTITSPNGKAIVAFTATPIIPAGFNPQYNCPNIVNGLGTTTVTVLMIGGAGSVTPSGSGENIAFSWIMITH